MGYISRILQPHLGYWAMEKLSIQAVNTAAFASQQTTNPRPSQAAQAPPNKAVEISLSQESLQSAAQFAPKELNEADKSSLARIASMPVKAEASGSSHSTLQSPSSVPLPHQQAEMDVSVQALDQANEIPKAVIALLSQ